MKTRLESTLIDAMSYCSLRGLPEVENGVDVWIRAIAKVAKSDGSYSYVYVEKDLETLENKVRKDFGTAAAIIKYIEYYPFSYLDASYVPEFKTNTKEERIEYLSKVSKYGKNYGKMSLKQLNREVIRIAIKYQLDMEKNRQKIGIE